MLTARVDDLRKRAESIATVLSASGIVLRVVDSLASVGGGAFPTTEIPSVALAVSRNAQSAEEKLRMGEPAVIGHIADGELLLDLRSVMPAEDARLTDALLKALR
jgi:L-seryl-tRNA(Ser) seleniumtransferase